LKKGYKISKEEKLRRKGKRKEKEKNVTYGTRLQWRNERRCLGGSNSPRNSEVLTKLSRIHCYMENTSVTV
jgi:hypothetical protein